MSILRKNNSVSNAFVAGTLLSVAGSVAIWTMGTDAQQLAIFVGLWALNIALCQFQKMFAPPDTLF